MQPIIKGIDKMIRSYNKYNGNIDNNISRTLLDISNDLRTVRHIKKDIEAITPGNRKREEKATERSHNKIKSDLSFGNDALSLKSDIRFINGIRRGQVDEKVYTPTPQYKKAYSNNGGATGDLVFALHKLRRG